MTKANEQTDTRADPARIISGMGALYRMAVVEVMTAEYRWTGEAAERLSAQIAESVRRRAQMRAQTGRPDSRPPDTETAAPQ